MQPTILLVDDNAIQAATRQAILKRAGYFVIPVLHPERALEQLRAHDFADPVELIITDHIMPGMNGAEFVEQVRQLRPTVPVLVISGLIDAEDAYKDLNVTFRLKPLLPASLLSSVEELVANSGDDSTPNNP